MQNLGAGAKMRNYNFASSDDTFMQSVKNFSAEGREALEGENPETGNDFFDEYKKSAYGGWTAKQKISPKRFELIKGIASKTSYSNFERGALVSRALKAFSYDKRALEMGETVFLKADPLEDLKLTTEEFNSLPFFNQGLSL